MNLNCRIGGTENVMCDVIKIHQKRNYEWRSWKKTLKMDLDVFYDVTHDTFRITSK